MFFILFQKKKKKKNKLETELLPLMKDIKKLRKFLLHELNKMLKFCQESTKDRENCLNREQFSYLQKLVLVRIFTLRSSKINNRTVGES